MKAPPIKGPRTAAIPYVAPREPKKLWSSLWRRGESNDREQPDGYTSTAQSSDRSAYDECFRILGHAADQTTKLEDEEGDQVPQLEREVLEELSPGRLKACGDQS